MLVDIIVNQISAEDFSVPEVKDINLPFSKVTPICFSKVLGRLKPYFIFSLHRSEE